MNKNKILNYGKRKFRVELERACHLYLLHGLRNGSTRVEYHFAIANIIFEYTTGKINDRVITSVSDYKHFKDILKIHDETQYITSDIEKLTGFNKEEYIETRVIRKFARLLIEKFNLK